MTDEEQQLRQALKRAAEPDPVPPAFAAVWSRAEADYARSKRRYTWIATAAAVVAVVVVGLKVSTPVPDEPSYIEMAELLDTTSWTAPSDVLMPEYQFDIYEDLPAVPRSTKPVEGALL